MARKQIEEIVDPTGWMIDNDVANFLLLRQVNRASVIYWEPPSLARSHYSYSHILLQKEVLFMCMIGYTLLNGSKVFAAAPKGASVSYKLVSMILACTGGGILVPLFINAIPVPLANDLYPLAILVSFAIHYYFPIVWEVIKLSPLIKVVPRVSSDTVIVCGPHRLSLLGKRVASSFCTRL